MRFWRLTLPLSILAFAISLFFVTSAQAEANEGPTLMFEGGQVAARTLWLTKLSTRSEAKLRLEFTQGVNGAPLDVNGRVAVQLWMPDMGHGSSPVTLTQVDVGVIEVSEMYFVMGGEWHVRVKYKNSQGQIETAILKVNLAD